MKIESPSDIPSWLNILQLKFEKCRSLFDKFKLHYDEGDFESYKVTRYGKTSEEWSDFDFYLDLIYQDAETVIHMVSLLVVELRQMSAGFSQEQQHSIEILVVPPLSSLFASELDFNSCYLALQHTEKPVLGPNGNFNLGERDIKTAIRAWFHVLVFKGKVKKQASRNREAAILNGFFDGLKISGRRVGDRNGYKYDEFYNEFLTLIR